MQKWSLTKPSNAYKTFSLKAEFSYKRHFNDRKSKRSCNRERKSKQLRNNQLKNCDFKMNNSKILMQIKMVIIKIRNKQQRMHQLPLPSQTRPQNSQNHRYKNVKEQEQGQQHPQTIVKNLLLRDQNMIIDSSNLTICKNTALRHWKHRRKKENASMTDSIIQDADFEESLSHCSDDGRPRSQIHCRKSIGRKE